MHTEAWLCGWTVRKSLTTVTRRGVLDNRKGREIEVEPNVMTKLPSGKIVRACQCLGIIQLGEIGAYDNV